MDFETTIIGAGVVGLAIASELSTESHPMVVLERHGKFGQETSSHNSEVLHAGLYYPTGSLKAKLCLEGNGILRDLGNQMRVPVRLLTKLVVGDAGEEEAIHALYERAKVNGVEGLRILDRKEILHLEPNLTSSHALFSAHTGILDSHALMQFFIARAVANGVDFAFKTRVTGIEKIAGGYRLETRDADDNVFPMTSVRVVNAAGLASDQIAALAGIDVDAAGYRLHPCKGDYFSARARCARWVSRLIYPVPSRHAPGLGIHVTLDLGGRMRLGPDASYLPVGVPGSYAADPAGRPRFARAVKRYLPAITEDDLAPEFAGIRPKLQGPDDPPRDFVITEETDRGLPGFVNLIGIESPGLTAAPAIGRHVARLLSQ